MSDSYAKPDADEEEDEEQLDDTGYKTIKDAVIFAIDVSSSMLRQPPPSDDKKADRESATIAALKCAYQLMQQRIISSPNDMMGILLFGTEKSRFQGEEESKRTSISYPHCYLLTDLDVPDAPSVKRLRSMVEEEEEAADLLVPSKEPVSMANVLFCANQIFTTKAPNFSSRRLFLVTDNDNPHATDKQWRSAAAVRAKDLYDLGVIIELFPISRPDHDFDRTTFYDDIVYRPISTDENAPAPLTSAAKASSSGSGISLLQSLISNINSKAAPRRTQFSIPFEIGPGLKIGVKGYILIKRQEPARTCYVWTGGEKPQLAIGSTTQMADDTARTVEKTEIRKAFTFGGDKISFSDEELKKIKNFGEPGITIIGFKNRDLLPIWASTRAPYFIYPSEMDFVGSTRVFSALQQKLMKSKKFALVWFIPRKNATPVLAAAVPGEEKYNDEGEQISPPGIWIIQLPYTDDIRQDPGTTLVKAPESLVDLMKTVIMQLMLPKGAYDPRKYPNPALQWHYRILQALALDDVIPEKPEDKTVPRFKQIHKRAGQYTVDWGTELEAQFQAWVSEHGHRASATITKAKRAAPDAASWSSKKIKTEASADAPSEEEMRVRFEKETLDKLTLPVLKEFASGRKLGTGGRKIDVVERIVAYFENK